jgi:tetratricopeptide (TPR) repeat protein
LYAEARRAGDDLARWIAAREAAHALEGLLADASPELARKRMAALVEEVRRGDGAAEADRKLLAELADIRSAESVDAHGMETDAEYADAFREAGMDLEALPPAEAGAKIRARPDAVREALAAALDDWAALRRGARRDPVGANRLTEAARLADPDAWRGRLRAVLQIDAKSERLAGLKDLAGSARGDQLPAVSLVLLGEGLLSQGDANRAESVLREGLLWHPGDIWLNYKLGQCLERQARREEAIRYYTAARALRPETAHALAHALQHNGEIDQSIAIFRDLVRLRPKDGENLACLGEALQALGRTREAQAILDVAIAVSREAIGRKPNDRFARSALGHALQHQGKLDEAIAEFRTALRLRPDIAVAHNQLGVVLIMQGKPDEAVAEFGAALRLEPENAPTHNNLGYALSAQGKFDEAVAEFRTALRLEPDYPEARRNLGYTLGKQGRPDEALAEFREILRLRPNNPEAHCSIGNHLLEQGKLDEAIAEYREALRLKPDFPEVRYGLGNSLRLRGKLDEAIGEYHEALRLRPDYPEARLNLGSTLALRGKLDEAIGEFREALRLRPNDPEPHSNVGNALRLRGELDEAIGEFREALRLRPDFRDAHHNLGLALLSQGKYTEAVVALRRARDLTNKTDARLVQEIGQDLGAAEQRASLAARLPEVLTGQLRPTNAADMLGFAQLSYDKRLHAASARFWTEAFRSWPKLAEDMQAGHRYSAACAAALAGCGQGQDDPQLDGAAKARWRKRAVDWLKADLASWTKVLESGPPQARPLIAQTLQHRKVDPDLAGLRDPAALGKLPEDDQESCRALWAEADALLAKARAVGKP